MNNTKVVDAVLVGGKWFFGVHDFAMKDGSADFWINWNGKKRYFTLSDTAIDGVQYAVEA